MERIFREAIGIELPGDDPGAGRRGLECCQFRRRAGDPQAMVQPVGMRQAQRALAVVSPRVPWSTPVGAGGSRGAERAADATAASAPAGSAGCPVAWASGCGSVAKTPVAAARAARRARRRPLTPWRGAAAGLAQDRPDRGIGGRGGKTRLAVAVGDFFAPRRPSARALSPVAARNAATVAADAGSGGSPAPAHQLAKPVQSAA
jgi:hypothetical protein